MPSSGAYAASHRLYRLDLHPYAGENVRHTDWDELAAPACHAIETRTAQVCASRKATTGLNSQLAVVLDTDTGTVFIKGMPIDHSWAVRQEGEATINPRMRAVAPQLLGHEQAAGWDLLAFEYIQSARHADHRPSSPDLPQVIGAIHRLSAISCPDLPVKQGRQCWTAYVDREADLDLLEGGALPHTGFNPLNILSPRLSVDHRLGLTHARRGVHRRSLLPDPDDDSRPQREGSRGASRPGWQQAPPVDIDVFALASARQYDEIALNDPQPFKQRLAAVSHDWAVSPLRCECGARRARRATRSSTREYPFHSTALPESGAVDSFDYVPVW